MCFFFFFYGARKVEEDQRWRFPFYLDALT